MFTKNFKNFKIILLSIILILLMYILSSCNNKIKDNITKLDKCDKIDSLIKQIIFIPEIYTPFVGIDKNIRYLVLKSLRSKTDSLYGFSKVLFLVSNESETHRPGTVTLDSVNFNKDSSIVNLEIGYYMKSNFRVTTTFIIYKWNLTICRWEVDSTSTAIH